jgi:EAL domain-containing protein (putative c-di-GMP-specific phosphodiesterase class I)
LQTVSSRLASGLRAGDTVARFVAEGVQRAPQLERLTELGCDRAQGLLLARPMSAEALAEVLSSTAPALV